jgi:hypothetical protein
MSTHKLRLAALAVAGLASVVVGLTSSPAMAGESSATAACRTTLGSVAPTGQHAHDAITATNPPTHTSGVAKPVVYPAGAARLSSTFSTEPFVPESYGNDGYVVLGDALYYSNYTVNGTGELDPTYPVVLRRIGGGWSDYTALEVSRFDDGKSFRTHAYGLRNDGVLTRWTVTSKGWTAPTTYSGLGGVKSMTLISKTRTYDTFLANTRAGVLETIHIPTTAPLKPVIKTVRSSTWQGFEALVGTPCGQYGTLLTGIDKDTGKAYLYAVGHATGTTTVIQGLGAVPGTFTAPFYFRSAPAPFVDPVFGE